MAVAVIMPKPGITVESCIVTKWMKKKGDTVKAGDVLFSYETDKAAFDEAAQTDGVLLEVFYNEGDEVPCLANMCVIGQPGESTAEFANAKPAAQEAKAEPAKAESAPAAAEPVKAAAPVKKTDDAEAVIMPKPGITVESCILTKWMKKKGDYVKVGDILFSYETDKAAFDEESRVEGTLLEIFYNEGDDVPCLANVCVIGKEGANTAVFSPKAIEAQAPATAEKTDTPAAAPAAAAAIAEAPSVAAQDAGFIKISPRAKALAEKSGADLRYATGTGPEGRIIERDVRALIEKGLLRTSAAAALNGTAAEGTGIGGRVTTADIAAPAKPAAPAAAASETAEPEYTVEKLTNIRKVIAKSMHESLATMAQLTLNTSFDATEILAYRAKLKAYGEAVGMANITLNDMILFAVSRTLLSHKLLNAHFVNDEIRYFKAVNLGVAVDTERGLMVPTIMGADRLTLNEIAIKAKELANGAKKGTISPDLLRGGTFTVTNLGSLDIESFTPVINPPQTAILGVNNIVQRAKEVNGEIKFYPAMGLSLTFDHRVLDGAPAARFLKDLKANLENFSLLLAK